MEAVKNVIVNRKVKRVILVARWEYYLWSDNKTTVMAEGSSSASEEDAIDALISGLRLTISWLSEHGVEVYLVPQVPHQTGDPIRSYLNAAWIDQYPVYGISQDEYIDQQKLMDRVLERLTDERFTIVRIRDAVFGFNGRSLIGDKSGPFYCDDDHLSPHGAVAVLLPALENSQLFLKTDNATVR